MDVIGGPASEEVDVALVLDRGHILYGYLKFGLELDPSVLAGDVELELI